MTNPALDLLLSRRSVSANSLAEPGPNAEELQLMLRAATRVPDHKKLVPWRFLLFQGEARAEFGKVLAETCRTEEKDAGNFRLENEAKRFLRAPLVIAAISRVVKKIRPRQTGSRFSRPAPPARISFLPQPRSATARNGSPSGAPIATACAKLFTLLRTSGPPVSSILERPRRSPRSASGRALARSSPPGGAENCHVLRRGRQ
jgi:nitroreductase